jgi:hypothetical protein
VGGILKGCPAVIENYPFLAKKQIMTEIMMFQVWKK